MFEVEERVAAKALVAKACGKKNVALEGAVLDGVVAEVHSRVPRKTEQSFLDWLRAVDAYIQDHFDDFKGAVEIIGRLLGE